MEQIRPPSLTGITIDEPQQQPQLIDVLTSDIPVPPPSHDTSALIIPHADISSVTESPHPHPIIINRDIFYSADFYPFLTQRSNAKKPSSPSEHCHKEKWTTKTLHPCSIWRHCQSWTGVLNFLQSYFYIFTWLPKYLRDDQLFANLQADLIAAVGLATTQISDGLAFGWLTGLAPVNGLYMAIFPVLFYALIGQSRHVSIGTFPIVSLVCHHVLEATNSDAVRGPYVPTAARTLPMTRQPLEVLISLGSLVGAIQIVIGIFKLEKLFALLSDSILSAFLAGVSFHVLINQAFPLLGIDRSDSIHVKGEPIFPLFPCLKFVKSCMRLISRLWETKLCVASIAFGTIGCICMWKFVLSPWLKKRWTFLTKFPSLIDLLMILLLTCFAQYSKLPQLELIPQDFTRATAIQTLVPKFQYYPSLALSAIFLSFTTYAHTYFLGKRYAKKHGYRITGNREMLALGVANLASSFFNCYPCSPSLPRTEAQETAGQKSQIAAMLSALFVFLFLHFLFPYLDSMPVVVLSAIITIKVLVIIQLKLAEFYLHARSSWSEAIIWLATFFGILMLGISIGMVFGTLFAIGLTLYQLASPSIELKHSIADSECYVVMPIDEHEDASRIVPVPKALVVAINAPLMYLNSEHLKLHFTKQVIDRIRADRLVSTDAKTPSILSLNTINNNNQSTVNSSVGRMIARILRQHPQHLPVLGSPAKTKGFEHHKSSSSSARSFHSVILDCTTVPYIDLMGVELLLNFEAELREQFDDNGIQLLLAGCNEPVLRTLRHCGFFESVERQRRIFLTVHDAVAANQLVTSRVSSASSLGTEIYHDHDFIKI